MPTQEEIRNAVNAQLAQKAIALGESGTVTLTAAGDTISVTVD